MKRIDLSYLIYNNKLQELEETISEQEKSLETMHEKFDYLETKFERLCFNYGKLCEMVNFGSRFQRKLDKANKKRFAEIKEHERSYNEFVNKIHDELDDIFKKIYNREMPRDEFEELYEKYMQIVDSSYEKRDEELLKYCDELYDMFEGLSSDNDKI